MTHSECTAALQPLDRRICILALVAQIHERCLAECHPDVETALTWALDAARRWCLGEADEQECHAAATAAYAANAANAAYAANAAHAAANAVYAAHAVANAEARRSLVDAVCGVEWQDAVVASGNVRTRTHVWWREGHFGGRWVSLTDADAVRFDVVLEAV